MENSAGILEMPLDCLNEIFSHCTYLQTQLVRATCKYLANTHKQDPIPVFHDIYVQAIQHGSVGVLRMHERENGIAQVMECRPVQRLVGYYASYDVMNYLCQNFLRWSDIYHYMLIKQPIDVLDKVKSEIKLTTESLEAISYKYRQHFEDISSVVFPSLLESNVDFSEQLEDLVDWIALHDFIPDSLVTESVKAQLTGAWTSFVPIGRGAQGVLETTMHSHAFCVATKENNFDQSKWLAEQYGTRVRNYGDVGRFEWNSTTLQLKYQHLLEKIEYPYEKTCVTNLDVLRPYQIEVLIDVINKGATISFATIGHILRTLPSDAAATIINKPILSNTLADLLGRIITRCLGGKVGEEDRFTLTKLASLCEPNVLIPIVEELLSSLVGCFVDLVTPLLEEIIPILASAKYLKGKLQKHPLAKYMPNLL